MSVSDEVVYSSLHILEQDPQFREKEKEALKRIRDAIDEEAKDLK